MRPLMLVLFLSAYLTTTAVAQVEIDGLTIGAQSDLSVTEAEAAEQASLRIRQLLEKDLSRRTSIPLEVLRPSVPRLMFAAGVQQTQRTESVLRPYGTLYRRHEQLRIPDRIVWEWLSEIEVAEHSRKWRQWLIVTGIAAVALAAMGLFARPHFQRRQQQIQHKQQRLQTARRWANAGRVVSALGFVNSLAGTTAKFFKQDCDEQRQRFERHLSEATGYIEQQEFVAARNRLDRAGEIQAVHPRLVEVEARYRKACRMGTPARPVSEPISGWAGVPILQSLPTMTNRAILNDTLLATGHELVIGNPLGEGVTVPLLAGVHSRHAVVVRHRRGHQLLAISGRETRRNGELVNGACELAHGDVLQFGPSICQWRYLRPIHNSLTVVLEPTSTTLTDIRLPDGSSCRRVVWWDDELVLAAQAATPAHVVVSELPTPELRLQRQPRGFTVAASEAELSLERGSVEIPVTNDVVSWPCRLIVRVEMSESDILRQQFASRGRRAVSDHCVLDFRSV